MRLITPKATLEKENGGALQFFTDLEFTGMHYSLSRF